MPERHYVAVTDYVVDDLATEKSILGDIADVEALGAKSESDLVAIADRAEAIMVYHSISISRDLFSQFKKCRVVVRCGVGYDNLDLAAARAAGIDVVNIPDYGTEDVADTAIGMALSLFRGIHCRNSHLQHEGGEWTHLTGGPVYRVRGKIFGIVGLGRIGIATAIRARSLGMDVVFYDPYKEDGYDKSIGIRRADSLEELLTQAHVTSLHCPLTRETQAMIDAAAIARMPRGAFLVNTARGGVVDTRAVVHALESGHLAGAALDVLEHEPPRDDHPLLAAWRDPAHPAFHRLILNPHAAFYCEEGVTEMRTKAARAVRNALTGKPYRNLVN